MAVFEVVAWGVELVLGVACVATAVAAWRSPSIPIAWIGARGLAFFAGIGATLIVHDRAPIVGGFFAAATLVALVATWRRVRDAEVPEEADAPSPAASPRRPAWPEDRARVLIVAHEPEANAVLTRALSVRYDTTTVSDAARALAERSRGTFDLVVANASSVELPDDRRLLERLLDDEIPVVVVGPDAQTGRAALLDGSALDYVTASFDPRELEMRVRNLVVAKRTRDALMNALGTSRDELNDLADQVTSHRRNLENALTETRLARSMAERAAGMKSNLLRMMAHELRTPVAAVQLQVTLLERADSMSEDQRDVIARIRRNLARLLDLIETALEYARIESDKFELKRTIFSLPELADDVVNELEPHADQKSLSLEVDANDDDVPPLESDANLVRLVIVNLAINAVKYTQEGGVTIRVRHENGEHRLVVEDTGPGIPKGQEDEIFEPFTRGDDVRWRSGSGSGLGLALVKEMVGALGGRIVLKSEEQTGTTVEVFLPPAPLEADATPPPA